MINNGWQCANENTVLVSVEPVQILRTRDTGNIEKALRG